MSVNSKMTAIADAIRAKTGGTEALTLDGMAEAVAGIEAGGGGDLIINGLHATSGTFTVASDISSGEYTIDAGFVSYEPRYRYSFVYILDGFPNGGNTRHLVAALGYPYKTSYLGMGGQYIVSTGSGSMPVATYTSASYLADYNKNRLRITMYPSNDVVLVAGVTYGWIYLYS